MRVWRNHHGETATSYGETATPYGETATPYDECERERPTTSSSYRVIHIWDCALMHDEQSQMWITR